MIPKYPPDEFVKATIEYMKSLNEYQSRIHLATLSLEHGYHGVALVCELFGVSKTTVYKGRHKLPTNYTPDNKYVRRRGGGRKR